MNTPEQDYFGTEDSNILPVRLVLVMEASSKNEIFVVNAESVPIEDLLKSGAEKVKVRYLIDERHGSNLFALRIYTVGKNGRTPLDQHQYEHQVYVMNGEGSLRMQRNGSVSRLIRAGDTVFIPSNAVHQFTNEREEPLVFLCVKSNPSLYTTASSGQHVI